MFSKKWRKALALTLSASMLMSGIPMWGNSAQAVAGEVSQQTYVQLSDSDVTGYDMEVTRSRVAVHDPSVIQDPETGRYYIFGSHLAWAWSDDLENWTIFTNNLNKNFTTIFAAETAWSAQGASDYTVDGNMWAPDVIWNEQMGKWCMYMSINGMSWNSTICLLTADSLAGDWTYVGMVIQSGMGMLKTPSFDYEKVTKTTDISRYTSSISNKIPTIESHAIDPSVIYDDDGNLWMTYGSWSGGISLLRLDNATGLRDYSTTYEDTNGVKGEDGYISDPYMGYKIAGGSKVSGEGPYLQKIGDYYYFFTSYGGFAPTGGYNMRIFRSKDIRGPYLDISGDDARTAVTGSNTGNVSKSVGFRLMSYYQWDFMDRGETAQGHNSVITDKDTGKSFVIYHTKFDDGTDFHEVRVHQLFINEDGWTVAAPFEYNGETISETGYAKEEICGSYEVIMHSNSIDYANLECCKQEKITLNEDGTISGAYTGTWSATENSPYVTMVINNMTYKGVFSEGTLDGTDIPALTFSVAGNNDLPFWGYKTNEKASIQMTLDESINESIIIPAVIAENIDLPTEGYCGTTIEWRSDNKALLSDGTVNYQKEDADVTLTAVFTNGIYQYEKDYKVKVLGKDTLAQTSDVLLAEYYTDEAIDLSKGAGGTYQVENPYYYANVDISEGAVITFDVAYRGESDRLADILSFMGSDGRMYLTRCAYLGYNAWGGIFDANLNDDWGEVKNCLTLGQTTSMKLKFTSTGFEVYVDDALFYSSTDCTMKSTGTLTDYSKVLEWLTENATTVYFGWGSWWENLQFDGTISNVKFYYTQPKVDTGDIVITESDGKVLAGSYYENEEKDLSSGGKTAVDSFDNPFYGLSTDMKEASIEFDVTRSSASTLLSNVLGLGDSTMTNNANGRMYFTGGSYLGFNDWAGNYMDANINIVDAKRTTQTKKFTIKVQGGTNKWSNVVAVFATGAVGTTGYKEYAVIRADSYGWGGGTNFSVDGNPINYTVNYNGAASISDDDLIAIMKDATIEAEITRTADGVSLKYEVTGANGKSFSYTAATKVNTDAALSVFFSTDQSTISVTPEGGDTEKVSGPWWTRTSAYAYDAWDLGGYFQAEDYLKDNEKVHVEIVMKKSGFEVYFNDELKYSSETMKDGTTLGKLNMSSYTSMLKWLRNKAKTVWIGGGSFWEDAFNGSISNLKFYYTPDTSSGIYIQDYEEVSDASKVWKSVSAQEALSILTDTEHGNYVNYTHVSSHKGSRSMKTEFSYEAEVLSALQSQNEYYIEFDAALTPGNDAKGSSELSLMGNDFAFNDNNVSKAGSILKLTNTGSNSTTWNLLNGNETVDVTIPKGTWCHYKAEINKTKGTCTLTITNGATVICSQTAAIASTGNKVVTGIFFLGGRYTSNFSIDNIVVNYDEFEQADFTNYTQVLKKAKSYLALQEECALYTQESISALQTVVSEAEQKVKIYLTSDSQGLVDTYMNNMLDAINALAYQTYTIQAGEMSGGSVTGLENEGIYQAGDSVALTAVPEDGYEFAFWVNKDAEKISNLATLKLMAIEDASYYPVFVPAVENIDGVNAGIALSDITLPEGWSFEETEGTVLYGTYSHVISYQAEVLGKELTYAKTISITADMKDGIGEKLGGYSLSLNGNIGVNFYIELADKVTENADAYMQFTLPDGEVTKVPVSQAVIKKVNNISYHVFTCEVAAKEMTADIQAQIISGEEKGTLYTYTVKQYAEYILNHTDDFSEEIQNLVKAMLNYGDASQTVFDYQTDAPANEGLSEQDKVIAEADFSAYAYTYTKSEEVTGITYVGSSLVLESETLLKHYFKLADGVDAEDYVLTLKTADGDVTLNLNQTVLSGETCYYVKTPSINAKDLGTNLELQIQKKDVDAVSVLSYGAFSYAYLVAQTENADAKLVVVTNALYQYYLAAETYFKNK